MGGVVRPSKLTIDPYPETPLGRAWQFKVRVGNRNGVFGLFGKEVALSSGQLPRAPRNMQAEFSNTGFTHLYWEIPSYLGDAPFKMYQVRCTTSAPWQDVANTQLN